MEVWWKVVLGSFAFIIFWLTAVFNNLPILPIGRTSGAILGAVLMVVFQVVTPAGAYASIDLSVLGLLFGTMVVSIYLERANAYTYLGKMLAWKSFGPRDLLARICIVAGVTSACFTNDTCCTVLTGFVLQLTREHNLPAHPFLMALACSANIGSAATPIGNPQNLVIATNGGISFGKFVLGILPATVVGLVLNTILLLVVYWKALAPVDTIEPSDGIRGLQTHLMADENIGVADHEAGLHTVNGVGDELHRHSGLARWKGIAWSSGVYLITLGMMAGLIMGLNMSWTTITAALALVVLDFRDAHPSLMKVSYSLLVFFCGMFMTMYGFEETGIPDALWGWMANYSQINKVTGLIVLSIAIMILSNMISNVPAVLLLGARMAAAAAAINANYVTRSWLVLAWVSTVAGNLTLIGSAANMIVCEQARRYPRGGYDLTFWTHLIFGFPSTILVTVAGLLVMSL